MAGPVGTIRVLAEIDEAENLFFSRPAPADVGTKAWLVSQSDKDNCWDPITSTSDRSLSSGWNVKGVYETFALEPVSGRDFATRQQPLSSYLYAAIDPSGGNWLVAFTEDASHAQAFFLDADGHCRPASAGDDLLKTLEIPSIVVHTEFPDAGEDESLIYNAWEFMMLLRGRNSVL